MVGRAGQRQGVVEGGLVFLGKGQDMFRPAVHFFSFRKDFFFQSTSSILTGLFSSGVAVAPSGEGVAAVADGGWMSPMMFVRRSL